MGYSLCANEVITAPALVNQSYIITTAYADYAAPNWTVIPASCAIGDLDYTNEVTPVNTWITGVYDNLGAGKVVGWQSFDEIDKGQYVVSITG